MDLKKISVIGTGLLGSSVSLAAMRSFPAAAVSAYSHRSQTREKARRMQVAGEVTETMEECVQGSDLVILATPIRTFETIFEQIGPVLKAGCIVTDVGSTKTLPHRWAEDALGKAARYVGSHPIAGSEKRGVEYARDDLLSGAYCILTRTAGTDADALVVLEKFWRMLGCRVEIMSPQTHDRIFGMVSHLPHLAATALVNANRVQDLQFAGRGFMDGSRVASGPPNIWTDIFLTNRKNSVKGIERLIGELEKLKTAIDAGDEKAIERLLEKARLSREAMIEFKIKQKTLF